MKTCKTKGGMKGKAESVKSGVRDLGGWETKQDGAMEGVSEEGSRCTTWEACYYG